MLFSRYLNGYNEFSASKFRAVEVEFKFPVNVTREHVTCEITAVASASAGSAYRTSLLDKLILLVHLIS